MKLDIQLFGALPARRISKTRKRLRRTHLKKEAPTVVSCPNCKSPIAPHRACTKCGYYKGKDVLGKETKEAALEKVVKTKKEAKKKIAPKKKIDLN